MAKKRTRQTAVVVTKAPERATDPSLVGHYRNLHAVVSDAQKDAADLALAAYDAANGTSFGGAFSMWCPGWDGITEPAPTPMAWMQNPQFNDLDVAASYVTAMASLSSIGVRWYEGLVVPLEVGNPANSVDSIYESGYNPGLPCADVFAAVAAWRLEVVGSLPPRDQLP